MGLSDALKKLGLKVLEETPQGIRVIAPEIPGLEHLAGREVLLPRESLGSLNEFGTVVRKDAEPVTNFGKTILTDPELAQSQLQKNTLMKEKQLQQVNEPKPFQPDIQNNPSKRRLSLKEMMDELNKIKEEKANTIDPKKMAGMLAGSQVPGQVDMNPIPAIKAGYDKYRDLKNMVFGKAAEQMDLTKDKSATEGIKNTLDIVADPINFIPGGVGAAIGGLQTGLDLLPSDKKNKFDKLKDMMKPNRKPSNSEDLP